MTRDDILKRRADLSNQLAQAKAQRREAEERLKDANRLVETIDGALQENRYWLDGLTREAEEEPFFLDDQPAELGHAAGGE